MSILEITSSSTGRGRLQPGRGEPYSKAVQVGTHLVDSVELTDQLGEVVVNGREPFAADLVRRL